MSLDRETKDFLVYIIEICAREFFGGDKSLAYSALCNYQIMDFYRDTYDTSHTLGTSYILDEMKDMFMARGYAI